jgi:hypothetical protein
MTERSFDRWAGISGILAVVCLGVGFGVALQNPPSLDASATEFASYFAKHQSDVQVGSTILGVGILFFLIFLGSLRAVLRAAEGGNGRLWGAAYAGGIVGASALVVTIVGLETAAFRPAEVSPDLTRAMNDLAVVAGAPAAAGLTAFLAATACIVLRTRVMAGAIGWLATLGAVAQPFAFGAGVTDHGAFAGDDVLGLFVPVIGFAVAVIALSVGLLRPSPSPAAEPVPPPD